MFIRGCSITGTDDNLCLQSGSREYTTENIHISGCEFTSMCAGIRIGLKSIGEIKNVVISDCTMKDVRREGIKVECTEGGRIANISVSNITMQNVARPIFILLNNRLEKEEFGSSLGLEEVPVIGSMQRLRFSGITAEDDMEMGEPHYRFGNDLMGAPWFNGIRVDAEKHHRIEGLTMENIYYHSFGGVKKSEIPEKYPEVLDRRIHPKGVCSENYFPDWSRVAYMDIRSVDGLYLSNIIFDSVEKDEREPYIIENCEPLKQEIFCR